MSRKKSIALIIEQLENNFFANIVQGAKMAAQELGINLLVVEFGRVHTKGHKKEQRYQDYHNVDYQRNTLISLANTGGVDLVALGPGTLCDDSAAAKELLELIADKKKLIISDNIPGCACIRYDNKKGIKEAVGYLVKEKHCSRIVMLAGPKDNDDANERLDAYREAMHENGLTISSGMISYGEFTAAESINAARELMEKNPMAEAFVCANDAMAIALYRLLKEKDIRIGKDVYVVGFDNGVECMQVEPQLASVNADSVNLGYEAMIIGSRMIDGESVGMTVTDSYFVPRPSCGFEPYSELMQFEKRRDIGVNTFYDIDRLCDRIVEYIFTGITHDYQSECQKKLIEDSIRRIISRYFGNVVKRNTSDDIYNEFANMIERGGLEYMDPNRLFRVFDTIYNMYCTKDMTMTGRSEIEHLLAKMKRKVVELLSVKADNIRKIDENVERNITRFFVSLMSLSGGMENECLGVLKSLEKLGVINAYLYMYDEPVLNREDDKWVLPESLLLKAYRNREEGAVSVPRSRQRVSRDEIIGNLILTGRIPETFVVIDLFYDVWQYGFILLDITNDYYQGMDIIGYQLCNAVHGMVMRDKERKYLLEKEELAEKELSYISEEIDVAGFLDLREFEGMAESMMPDSRGSIMGVSVMGTGSLIEMDKEYGSRSVKDMIKHCGSILKENCPGENVFGYMGNGVFASFGLFDDPEKIVEIAGQISTKAGELFVPVKTAVSAFRYHEELKIRDILLESVDRIS